MMDSELVEYRIDDLDARLKKLEARPDVSGDVADLIKLRNKGIWSVILLAVYMVKDPVVKFWESYK